MKRTVIIIFALFLLAACSSTNYDSFAQCLTDNGATFYGAFWCPHCTEQKEMFGSSVGLIDYVECSLPGGQGQTEVCQQAKIESYPTWEFADGSRQVGKLSFEALSQKTGCSVQ
ncbi:hypothetical protein COV18_02890 [Candidatus Woesearchaeota archaeon CG10_big_fil_rev_8_21_14_0_10_37_12]|nr:MAG: hypothetical protein COV18_02890 [Candidatus Woesearchaeota archaeon CG10_big_fil_rev_8_21_14_0_10_37_12]